MEAEIIGGDELKEFHKEIRKLNEKLVTVIKEYVLEEAKETGYRQSVTMHTLISMVGSAICDRYPEKDRLDTLEGIKKGMEELIKERDGR